MKKTSIKLTANELKYVKSQIKSSTQTNILFATMFIILSAGVLLLFVTKGLAYLFILIGILGLVIVFYMVNSSHSTLVVTLLKCTGYLSIRRVGWGKWRFPYLHVDNILLITPDVLVSQMKAISKENEGEKVTVLLTSFNVKDKMFYIPVRIGNDFCIDQAIKKHGSFFLHFETFKEALLMTTILCLFLALLFAPFALAPRIAVGSEIMNIALGIMLFLVCGFLAWKLVTSDYFDSNALRKKISCNYF